MHPTETVCKPEEALAVTLHGFSLYESRPAKTKEPREERVDARFFGFMSVAPSELMQPSSSFAGCDLV